jgi:hypothetical protein
MCQSDVLQGGEVTRRVYHLYSTWKLEPRPPALMYGILTSSHVMPDAACVPRNQRKGNKNARKPGEKGAD